MKIKKKTKQPKYWSAQNYRNNIGRIRDREEDDRLLQEWWDQKERRLPKLRRYND